VIFTGILIGTMFTLFVVPMFYTLISKRDRPAGEPEGTAAMTPAPSPT
jgi:multidrug efflux pump